MSFLCGCLARDKAFTHSSSSPDTQIVSAQSYNRNGIQTGHFTLSGDGQFIRPAGRPGHGPLPADDDNAGYTNVVPLPRYTPRPVSIHEKTLEAHLRDPSVSSESNPPYPQDEKSRNLYDEEVTSDGSSAISFPSSYGNTSTATRETPPPPYSPRPSAVINRSRSVSISSAMAVIYPPPMARVSGSRTSAARSETDDQSIRRHRRTSWESR